jgi:sRNA-binding regulator protein Hfq
MNKLLMSYKGEIMMAIDSVDSVDLSETDRELMFKHISTIIKQDRIRVRPQNQKAA